MSSLPPPVHATSLAPSQGTEARSPRTMKPAHDGIQEAPIVGLSAIGSHARPVHERTGLSTITTRRGPSRGRIEPCLATDRTGPPAMRRYLNDTEALTSQTFFRRPEHSPTFSGSHRERYVVDVRISGSNEPDDDTDEQWTNVSFPRKTG